MEPDFSGWATKAGLKCSDGRTIMPDAFKHQDTIEVPLVYSHDHDNPENILGKVLLTNKPEGVRADAFFNATPRGQHMKGAVEHGDIKFLSIFANNLKERSQAVYHGFIREVSLVLHGANPGALIDTIAIQHGDGTETVLDEAVITTGLEIELAHAEGEEKSLQEIFDSMTEEQQNAVSFMVGTAVDEALENVTHDGLDDGENLEHRDAEFNEASVKRDNSGKFSSKAGGSKKDRRTVKELTKAAQDIADKYAAEYDEAEKNGASSLELASMTDAARTEVEAMYAEKVGLDSMTDDEATQLEARLEAASFNIEQRKKSNALNHGDLEEDDKSGDADKESDGDKPDDKNTADESGTDEGDLTHQKGNTMGNVFEENGSKTATLSHGLDKTQMATLVHDTIKAAELRPDGSLKHALTEVVHAGDYGIDNIELLFPDAQAVGQRPELLARRTEWVAGIIDGAQHSPFSRVKSITADLTAEEARAKGYVKATMKKEEVIKLLRRVTTPTTVYKKQKLDRDDILDITDLDIVAWLKWEMRFMLEEELARAILIGDGREVDSEDKINEDHLRPIAWDNEMYTHPVVIPSNASADATVESVLRARKHYKGTGRPTFYTTSDIVTDMLLVKNRMGDRLYKDEAALCAAMRVSNIVEVEVLETEPDLLGIIVNISDYRIGADKGGQLTMFDDFDIDYNQYKYLMETRISGALTKPKSAVVIKRQSGTSVVPQQPLFEEETNTLTVPNQAGVSFFDVTDPSDPDGTELAAGDTVIARSTDVEARPDAGYSFPHNTDATFSYAYTA